MQGANNIAGNIQITFGERATCVRTFGGTSVDRIIVAAKADPFAIDVDLDQTGGGKINCWRTFGDLVPGEGHAMLNFEL